jgi:hypothetical protein
MAKTDPPSSAKPLFKGVTYWLNPNLGFTKYKALSELLDEHGAKSADENPPDFRTDGKFLVRAHAFEVDPSKVTHCITQDTDFPSYVSLKPEIAVVTVGSSTTDLLLKPT